MRRRFLCRSERFTLSDPLHSPPHLPVLSKHHYQTSRAQTTGAQFRAFLGSARTGRQEIRGVGDVRQVAETRVTTTFSSHRQALVRGCLAPQSHDRSVGACTSPKPQARIICSRHSYLLGDSSSLSFGSMRETPLTVKEAKGLGQAPVPRAPLFTATWCAHSGYPAYSTVYLPRCLAAHWFSVSQASTLAEAIPF